MMPVQAQTLLVVAVTTTIKSRSLLSHAELKLGHHDCLSACSPATSDEAVGRITASPCHDDAFADAFAQARVDVRASWGLG
jgi:hypothetical protein